MGGRAKSVTEAATALIAVQNMMVMERDTRANGASGKRRMTANTNSVGAPRRAAPPLEAAPAIQVRPVLQRPVLNVCVTTELPETLYPSLKEAERSRQAPTKHVSVKNLT